MPFSALEEKWQARWAAEKLFCAPLRPRPGKKFYCLDMFPYPSADGLHVGHPEGYTATDILCRAKRMQGFDVLHPMGWDAFGLPAENFALQTGVHPRAVTERNIANFKRQIRSLGFSYDWDREINTTDPAYYRWTQWIFLKLLERGLAYESTAPINWCPSCKTGLANEEVFGGACERCGAKVERRAMRQWLLKITAYADRLEKDLDELDWPASTLAMQRHWIGRSHGAQVRFKLEGGQELEVFTTRPDTLYGATYLVLAPEHPLLEAIAAADRRKEVRAYAAAAANRSELERSEQKEKTGVFTGAYALNPVDGRRLPVWTADYVLSSYGTGAIMAVPAHDARDWEFAQKFNLQVIQVVKPAEGLQIAHGVFCEEGLAVNSPAIEGLPTEQAKEAMIRWLEQRGLGRRTVQYKLRDWVFSRQRYWGEPIPVVHCPRCGAVGVPQKDLPVLLPDVADYKPSGTGESPLAAIARWVDTTCPKCSGPAKRETNTMPQWAGSCWYYLRFMDPKNDAAFCGRDAERAWAPVDCYVGGAEHAVLHLLYARFWHKVLFDLGLVSTKEPFQRLRHQGMIRAFSHRDAKGVYRSFDEVEYDEAGNAVLASSGEPLTTQDEKMSKSKKNVVNPDSVLERYGADAFRLYEMFMGPFEQSKPWDMRNIEGVSRFLRKVWQAASGAPSEADGLVVLRHKTIKKVTDDIASFGFNTAISQLMIYANEISAEPKPARRDLEALVTLLHPFAPHLTEELWERLGHSDCLARQAWPSYEERYLRDSQVEYAVQVNGKVRATFEFGADAPEAQIREAALALDRVKAATAGKSVVKTIFVPNRLLNIVVK
ncbi:MAG: leucine--tRNA ligase [Elusimicrobia bacterium]|nr:leucine--tRNA ligase [Elusimicrobiota bacterium]MDE2236395.1 leucine--tRNA ligase [Elusimicrobiota bacterium]MDE2426547.1 leucine--tRNA ligase [Elusimicrobiota bacterium]